MPRNGVSVSVVVPALNAERTIGRVVRALVEQEPSPREIIVVDDGSTDRTAEIAAGLGSRVISRAGAGSAGGARNRGWDEATGDVVLFLDSDAIPAPGFAAGLERALSEFPGAIVGCARTFTARTAWGWVAHLQGETPYLPVGAPRRTAFVSSYCMAVPRLAPLRWDESYGGEDGLFCVDALDAGPRACVRPSLPRRARPRPEDVRGPPQPAAASRLRHGASRPVQREGRRKRFFSRIPIHYFALVRLIPIHRRLGEYPGPGSTFRRLLPLMIVAEWTLGTSALRYALRRPALRELRGLDGMSRRRIVLALAIAACCVVVVAGAVFVSALSDEPSQTIRVATTANAREREVWRLLTDLEGYTSWNPTIVRADGTLEEGATLDLRFKNGNGDLESREVTVVDVNPIHKLRWQDRLALPGVRDRETTIRVRSFRPGRPSSESTSASRACWRRSRTWPRSGSSWSACSRRSSCRPKGRSSTGDPGSEWAALTTSVKTTRRVSPSSRTFAVRARRPARASQQALSAAFATA